MDKIPGSDFDTVPLLGKYNPALTEATLKITRCSCINWRHLTESGKGLTVNTFHYKACKSQSSCGGSEQFAATAVPSPSLFGQNSPQTLRYNVEYFYSGCMQ